jgi:hypothetical protein
MRGDITSSDTPTTLVRLRSLSALPALTPSPAVRMEVLARHRATGRFDTPCMA